MAARRTKAAPVAGKRCARMLGPKKQCPEGGEIYAMASWFCPAHEPKGDEACGHSLGNERCAYCGARKEGR